MVTAGSGIVANEQEEREISVGDVVHIQAGEKHWHGAKKDTTLSHITITTPGSHQQRSAKGFQLRGSLVDADSNSIGGAVVVVESRG